MEKNYFEVYRKTHDRQVREKIIIQYAPLVKVVAGRLSIQLHGHVDLEDLISYGVFGLIDAIDKFDPGKGVKFETYASLRIRGSIIDSIRKLDWVPRTLRQDAKKLESAFMELEFKLGREPNDVELAGYLQLSVEDTQALVKKSQISALLSYDDLVEQGCSPENLISGDKRNTETEPEAELLISEQKDKLAKAIEKLSEREQTVIILYYYEGLTCKEISKILGVSESRISQIHAKALLKLKTKLGKYFSGLNI